MNKSDRPKNVLIIESGRGTGGSAFSMYRIVKYLDKTQYQPYVFVYYRTPVYADIENLGIPVTVLPVYSFFPRQLPDSGSPIRKLRNYVAVYGQLLVETLFNGFRLIQYIRRNGIDIVHCNNGFYENSAAAFAARLTGKPCVSHVRGTEPLTKIEKLCSGWIDKFIVLNQDMYDLYSNAFGPNKVRLVFNGVDLDKFENVDPRKIRKEFSIGADTFCVGTFARLVDGKGIPEFLRAAAAVIQSHENLIFFVAGSGSDSDERYVMHLHALAKKLGIDNRVIFAGWRDDVQDCMSAMNLILQVSTTYPEGMSLAPIEAMALSKPVIVTDNPGYENIVNHGKTGFIVKAGDIKTLASRIERIVSDQDLARTMGKNGRQRVLDQFAYHIVIKRVEEIYVEAACD